MYLFELNTDLQNFIILYPIGILFMLIASKYFDCSSLRSFALYTWHTIFCILYAFLSIDLNADSSYYYITSFNNEINYGVGTLGVIKFVSIFSGFFNLSYFGVFLIFNIFGSLGLMAFDACLRAASFDKSRFVKGISLTLVLLPSASFWSVSIGKDALAFMSICFSIWAAISLKDRFFLMSLSILIMAIIRPHIAAVMIVSLLISLILSSSLSILRKALIIIFIVMAIYYLLPMAISYVGIDSGVNFEIAKEFIGERQESTQLGGGAIDLSNLSIPNQLYTYMFRPLPYEAHNLLSFFSSIENLFLLIVAFILIINVLLSDVSKLFYNLSNIPLYIIIFFLTSWILLSITTANIGIAARQKWMLLPAITYCTIFLMNIKIANFNRATNRNA
jgi:hypothetical protein